MFEIFILFFLEKVELITHVNSKVLQNVGIYLKQINNSKDVKAAMRHRNIDSLGIYI